MELDSSGTEATASVETTNCCIVGGGPAGLMLALLLARKSVPVTLLEAHPDFDRDFRGDTIHPSTLEILDQLGLAERLLQLPHGRIGGLHLHTATGEVTMASLSRLRTRFPFIAMMPQVRFLDFLAAEVRRYAHARIVMAANVQRLVQENGVVRGVRYHDLQGTWHEVRGTLTVAADGRHSRIRHLLGFQPIGTAPPMDVVWFRVPRKESDPQNTGDLYAGAGCFAVVLDRERDWQIGYVIPKGGFQHLRASGLDALRRQFAQLVPWLADRVDALTGWDHFTLLAVESSRLPCWHVPGLLLIGDAAHVMSPVGGVGINFAVQDAVEAANLLARPLLAGSVRDADLAAVQRKREFPVRVCQAIQGFIQRRLVARVLGETRPFRLPVGLRIMTRIPWLRNLPGRMIAFGVRRVRVET